MKKPILQIALVVLLSFQLSFGQNDYDKNALSIKHVWFNFTAPNEDDKQIFSDLSNGVELGFHRQYSNLFSSSLPLRIGSVALPNYNDATKKVTSYSNDRLYVGLDALLNLHFFKGKAISPFIYTGAGVVAPNFDFDNLYAQLPLGLGFDIRLSPKVFLSAQSDYRFAFEDGRDSWQHAIGFKLVLPSKDTDNDGIPDKIDECPTEFGTVNGCPDNDGDGIANKSDRCVNEPGVPENQGCPADRDRDGVYDRDDDCPDVAGTVKGCPDADKDGVADKDDRCPKDPGKLKGCPDSDGDGVADIDDKCPKVPGPASNNGCPPDRDNDGFPDATDPCPDLAGTINGCPDTDGDGVTDNVDKCPNTKGPASNNGCPEIKVEDKKTLDIAMRAVEFRTGTAVLTGKSSKILNDVVNVLNKYPEMNLNIEGHTDDIGDDMKNLKLSIKRAESCKAYLIKKGIKAERLNSSGYGESRPIGDNKTKEGRQSNRRTEFNPVWR
ncbi:MAG: OmpA family protein [Saprospiraceae bacterium]|nr:OmpA family protein [Saprospiraceae bacterium]